LELLENGNQDIEIEIESNSSSNVKPKVIESSERLKGIKEKLDKKDFILHHIPVRLSKLIGDNKHLMFNGKKIKCDYLVDLTHTLMMKYFNTKRLKSNLSSLILKEKYGAYYNYYIKWLIEHDIIKMTSNYCVGKKTKTFQLSRNCAKDSIRRKTYDRVLLKKKKMNILSDNLDKTNYDWIERDIRLKIIDDLSYVEIDYKKAQSILENMDGENLAKNEFSVDAIHFGDLYTHFDKYGRVHTNFTTLKSDIRNKCLTIDGEEIDELDIRNSQPLFLAILIDKHNDVLNCVDDGEYNFFKDLVCNGEFYDYYMSNSDIEKKKLAKRSVYKVLFGRNLDDNDNITFREMFPTIHDFVCKYKETYGEDNGTYKVLAYELQRSESNFLFNNIIKEIMIKYPYIKIFTVHDSIAYPSKYTHEVKEIFDKNIKSLFR